MKRVTLAVSGLILALVAGLASAQVTLYDREGLHGRSFTADRAIDNFDNLGFNDRASSVVVQRGVWQACEDAYFRGRCVTLRPGEYGSLDSMGMGNKISSIRPLRGGNYGYGYGRPDDRRYDRDRDYYQR
ncbi:MAG TPA: beta/gamma crystallin family protein [Casimicrobiaceae bacterium]|nr:beta/gamma crystallin family protein [Casimicrobiaceae bacterium]